MVRPLVPHTLRDRLRVSPGHLGFLHPLSPPSTPLILKSHLIITPIHFNQFWEKMGQVAFKPFMSPSEGAKMNSDETKWLKMTMEGLDDENGHLVMDSVPCD